MKLIIYWLTLMVMLPLGYLFWWKKTWRLILGVIILVVLTVGWILSWVLPGTIAFSTMTRKLKGWERKIDKEGWAETGTDEERRQWQKLEEVLKNTSQQKITPENREKIALEKEIIKWREEIKKADEEEKRVEEEKEKEEYWEVYKNNPDLLRMWEEKMKKFNQRIDEAWSKRIKGRQMSMRKEWEWVRKWGGKEDPPIFLFTGEEFNYQLTKERPGLKESWQIVEDRSYHSNVIDFGKHGNAESDFVRKRIEEIWDYWEQGNTRGRGGFVSNYPIILLKNIDKITNPALQKELFLILDSQKNTKYIKYQVKGLNGRPVGVEDNIDLSRFILIVTTSTSSPQLSRDLLAKLKHVEPFLEKYKWVIFFSSIGAEIIIFFLIKGSQKKNKWSREK